MTGIRVAQVMECTIGGTRRHIGELCAGLAARGFEVTLFASALRDPTFRADMAHLRAQGVATVELPMRRELGPVDGLHLARLWAALLRGRFDVVHTHSSKAGALGRTAALLTPWRERRVHTPHTFAFNFSAQFSPRKRRLFLAIERVLGRFTHALMHVSASERGEGVQLGIVPPERALVIENGIDPAPYRSARGDAVRAELGLRPGELLVGTVGLLNEAKGHAYLVDAAARVRAQVPGAVFAVAGEGALRGELEARIRARGLQGAFHLLGYRRDVPEVIAAMDLFVMPSLWEGMPYVVLEAMAAGRAVVASDVNGCRDLVEPGVTGVLVEKAAVEPLAEAITALLADEATRRRMGEEGARRVAGRYSLDRMVERYAAVYRSLVEERRR